MTTQRTLRTGAIGTMEMFASFGYHMTTPAISVDGVSKYYRLYHEKNQYLKTTLLRGRRARYEEFWAINDVSLEIPTGSAFGIIGSNGSGKSTLLKCLAGILTPDKGSIAHNGKVVALLELGAGFHPDLSGRENIYLNGAILGMTREEIDAKFDDIIEFSGLERFIDTAVKNYSSGMVVRLGFAIAINVDPEILIIDEVLAVGDASFQRRCLEKIEEFRKNGKTIVLVSHGLEQVATLCETVAWLDKGTIRSIGPANDVVNEYSAASHGAEPVAASEHGQRWGSLEVEITRIDLLDESGARPRAHITGTPLKIRLHYKAHLPLEKPVVGLQIAQLHGNTVWGVSTRKRGFELPNLHGEGHIDLDIPRLPLLEGTYSLSVEVRDSSETHVYDHWDNRINFEVAQLHVFDEGTFTIESNWSLNS